MICRQCGRQNPNEAQFCTNPECGAYLGWEAPTGPVPMGGPVHQTSGDQQAAASIALNEREPAVAPGELVTVGATIRNGGSRVEQFVVAVTGPAAPWAVVEPPTLSVYPGQQAECVVKFAPPRTSAALVGRYWFMVNATSTVNPGLTAHTDGVLDVAPFRELAANLVPQNTAGRGTTRHRLTLVNNGNLTEPVQVQASDPDGLLRFSVPAGELPVPPGQTDIDVAVRPPTRLFGKPRQHRFQFVVVPRPPTPPIPLDGGREAVPLIPGWMPGAAAALALLVGLIGAAAVIVPRLTASTPTPAVTTPTAPLVTSPVSTPDTSVSPSTAPSSPAAGSSSSPPAPLRTVRLQAEALLPAVSATAPVQAQANCCGVRWDNSAELWFTPTTANKSVTVAFNVPASGTYQLIVVQTRARDYGINTLAVDGRQVGNAFDGFHTPEVIIAPPQLYGSLRLTAGRHTLTLTVTGKNNSSIGYYAGLDYIELRPSTG